MEAPQLARETTATVTGWISDIEEARGGRRFVIRVRSISGSKPDATPPVVRVTVRGGADAFHVGDGIEVRARLQPPEGPVIPGGYDFYRAAFYQGLGAVGFAYGNAKTADPGEAPFDIRLWRPLEELRDTIRRRIESALPGDNGHIAAALIMGDQGGISEKTQDAMRASGLGHVLSISGLHMALVAGAAFWLLRALLALSPELALTRPIKKYAAAGALATAAFYLGISGGGVATDRAFVMLAIMLTAILLDRQALTLRNVALAALAVLAFAPESVITPSFQMSFAATLALIAGYEAIAARERQPQTSGSGRGLSARAVAWIGGLFLTSLIAGLATTPFAAYHFQRLAPLSLLANLAATPVVGLLIMPMALAAVVLMPFGLESLPLAAMNWGLDWMVLVAEKTAAWSEGLGDIRMIPAGALLLAVIGFLWLALWRERWRLAGLLPLAAALPLALSAPVPDILVDGSGTTVAVRAADGQYRIAGGGRSSFAVDNWLRADGDARDAKAPGLRDGVLCDPLGCIARTARGEEVALIQKPDAFDEDCRRAVVVISALEAPPGCAGETLVIDRDRLKRFGAHALYRDEGDSSDKDAKPEFSIRTAYPEERRPFMPPGISSQTPRAISGKVDPTLPSEIARNQRIKTGSISNLIATRPSSAAGAR
jgi:competence protein ComEC